MTPPRPPLSLVYIAKNLANCVPASHTAMCDFYSQEFDSEHKKIAGSNCPLPWEGHLGSVTCARHVKDIDTTHDRFDHLVCVCACIHVCVCVRFHESLGVIVILGTHWNGQDIPTFCRSYRAFIYRIIHQGQGDRSPPQAD